MALMLAALFLLILLDKWRRNIMCVFTRSASAVKRKLEFNEGLLKDLAYSTGGQYFHATDNDALQKIYTSINQLEKTKIKLTTYNRYTNEFLPWLAAGIILLFIELILRYTVFKKFP